MSEERQSGTSGSDAASPEREKHSTTEELSKLILGSMKSFSGEETVNWLKNVSENVPKGNVAGAASRTAHLTQAACIDTLFEHFQRYALQFNRQYPRNPEIHVHCSKVVHDAHGEDFYRILSTQEWGLALVAEPHKISSFVVRSQFIPDFAIRRINFAPFLEMQEATEGGEPVWYVEGDAISEELLPVIAKKLFARLIRVARGEASELEPFLLQLKEISPAERATSSFEQTMNTHKKVIVAVCVEMLKILDDEHEKLSAAGIKTIQGGQMDLAQKVMKQAEDLKGLREGIAKAIHQWQTASEAE